MRKLHFYTISKPDLFPGWPRRNRLTARLYLLIYYSSSEPCNTFPDAVGKEWVSANGQAGLLVGDVLAVQTIHDWAPAPFLTVCNCDCCRTCWASSLIWWARAGGLWDWFCIFKGISAQNCVKWSIAPEYDCKIVFNNDHRNDRHYKKMKCLPCDG